MPANSRWDLIQGFKGLKNSAEGKKARLKTHFNPKNLKLCNMGENKILNYIYMTIT